MDVMRATGWVTAWCLALMLCTGGCQTSPRTEYTPAVTRIKLQLPPGTQMAQLDGAVATHAAVLQSNGFLRYVVSRDRAAVEPWLVEMTPDDTASQLGLYNEGKALQTLKASLAVDSYPLTTVLDISVLGRNRDSAAKVADALARRYARWVRDGQITPFGGADRAARRETDIAEVAFEQAQRDLIRHATSYEIDTVDERRSAISARHTELTQRIARLEMRAAGLAGKQRSEAEQQLRLLRLERDEKAHALSALDKVVMRYDHFVRLTQEAEQRLARARAARGDLKKRAAAPVGERVVIVETAQDE